MLLENVLQDLALLAREHKARLKVVQEVREHLALRIGELVVENLGEHLQVFGTLLTPRNHVVPHEDSPVVAFFFQSR